MRRHIWGDVESRRVADWLYASTDKLHVLLFGLAAGKWFKHSPAYRTVFGADEVLFVLGGSMLASNPQTGEVLSCESGDSLFFRRDTWHHVYAQGSEPLRVLEFFAPPPATGTSGAYAAQRPYLDTTRYTRDDLLGGLKSPPATTLHRVTRDAYTLRMEGELVVGIIASTEHLTVAHIAVPAGAEGGVTRHAGDALIFALDGELMIRTTWQNESNTVEMGPRDAVFLPQGSSYEILNFAGPANALLGTAPGYLP